MPGGYLDSQYTHLMSGDGRFTVFGPQRHDSLTHTTLDIGRLTDADGHPSPSPSILSISDDGSVAVGTIHQLYLGAGGYSGTVAFLWSESLGLQTLAPPSPDHIYYARYVSGDGSTVLGSDNGYPFLWTRDRGLVDFLPYLNSLGVDTSDITFLRFSGLSDNGKVIAGTYDTPTSQHIGFVLTLPIPEPAAVLLLTPLVLCPRRPRRT